MRFLGAFSTIAALLPLATITPAEAAALPSRVGACVLTTIKTIGTRLEDGTSGKPIPGSGSAVSYADGGYGVSYDTIGAVEAARPGDRIRLCLASVPKGCPKGDDRGKVYRAYDVRTHKTWSLPDSEHACGGA